MSDIEKTNFCFYVIDFCCFYLTQRQYMCVCVCLVDVWATARTHIYTIYYLYVCVCVATVAPYHIWKPYFILASTVATFHMWVYLTAPPPLKLPPPVLVRAEGGVETLNSSSQHLEQQTLTTSIFTIGNDRIIVIWPARFFYRWTIGVLVVRGIYEQIILHNKYWNFELTLNVSLQL